MLGDCVNVGLESWLLVRCDLFWGLFVIVWCLLGLVVCFVNSVGLIVILRYGLDFLFGELFLNLLFV